MHSLEEIEKEYRKLDAAMEIDTSDIDIAFSKRSIRRYGSCKYELTPRGTWKPVKILIAEFLKTEDEAFWDTVRHEYAHAAAILLTGEKHGHDALWRELCKKAGGSGETYAGKTKAAEDNAACRAKYKVTCKKCGAESVYMRETKVIKKLRSWRGAGVVCNLCGGKKFEVIVLR